MAILKVAVDVPTSNTFDYRDRQNEGSVGSLVIIPFGNKKKKVGVVVEILEYSELSLEKLKNIEAVLKIDSLSSDVIQLAHFVSKYYCYPLGKVFAAFLPRYLRQTKNQKMHVKTLYRLKKDLQNKAQDFPPKALLEMYEQKKSLSKKEIEGSHLQGKENFEKWLEIGVIENNEKYINPKKNKSKFILEKNTIPIERKKLTRDQNLVINKISQKINKFKVWLLHGVTGSGKTEVYFSLIEKVVESKGQVLVLVPEINLTPQFELRFRQNLNHLSIASLSSLITERKRYDTWRKTRLGEIDVILGTRLAVSSEIPRLKLIIVDEEHDPSYKQRDGLKYNARDLAIYRAKKRNIPVVLGSATPSIESYKNVAEGKFMKLNLNKRPTTSLPEILIPDLKKSEMGGSLCQTLIKKIKIRLEKKEQSLIFINRRGYSTVIYCSDCRWICSCARCSARMTFHKKLNKILCHYCGDRRNVPMSCPKCQNIDLRPLGEGTQRVEEELERLFPSAKILRVDSDTTRSKNSFLEMREEIVSGKIDIIVGTQMLSKGHDFPSLTLVGVLGVDNSLYSSDYIASERLFQQLVQVAGRAGRGSQRGEVVIQTSFPENDFFKALKNHDYERIINIILSERKVIGFPPFAHQIIVRADSKKENNLFQMLQFAANEIKSMPCRAVVYEPSPALMYKIAGRFRGQLLVQSSCRKTLSLIGSHLYEKLLGRVKPNVRWAIDRDPSGIS